MSLHLYDEIEETEHKLAGLKAKLAEFEKLKPDEQLAISLHDEFCTHNHTDMCGWHYEIKNGVHDWTGNTHKRYLQKARNVVRKLPDAAPGDILQIARALKGI